MKSMSGQLRPRLSAAQCFQHAQKRIYVSGFPKKNASKAIEKCTQAFIKGDQAFPIERHDAQFYMIYKCQKLLTEALNNQRKFLSLQLTAKVSKFDLFMK